MTQKETLSIIRKMANDISPLELELKNRVGEIIFIDPKTNTSKQSIEHFVEKLVNLGEFIESHKPLHETFEKLYLSNELAEVRLRIAQKSETILTQVHSLFTDLTKSLDKEILKKLPSQKEITQKYKNQEAFTTTVDENIVLTLNRMNQFSVSKLVPDYDVINLGKDIISLKWDFDSLELKYPISSLQLEELQNHLNSYQSLREEYERMKKYFGLSDYYLVKGIWEWKTKRIVSMGQVRFLLSPLGKAMTDTLNPASLPEIQDDIRQYQESVRTLVKRYHEIMARNSYKWYKRLLAYSLQFIPDLIRKFI